MLFAGLRDAALIAHGARFAPSFRRPDHRIPTLSCPSQSSWRTTSACSASRLAAGGGRWGTAIGLPAACRASAPAGPAAAHRPGSLPRSTVRSTPALALMRCTTGPPAPSSTREQPLHVLAPLGLLPLAAAAPAVNWCLSGLSHARTLLPHPRGTPSSLRSGEKARRRDPRQYRYQGVPCPDFRKASGRDQRLLGAGQSWRSAGKPNAG